MPFVAQVAVGRRARHSIVGDDYDTRDGTGERDYIHVVDLAVRARLSSRAADCEAINVGTGQGITVKELVPAYEAACGHPIAAEIAPRRPEDVASSYAATAKAARLLNWRAARDVDDMCANSWLWQSENPMAFEGY